MVKVIDSELSLVPEKYLFFANSKISIFFTKPTYFLPWPKYWCLSDRLNWGCCTECSLCSVKLYSLFV